MQLPLIKLAGQEGETIALGRNPSDSRDTPGNECQNSLSLLVKRYQIWLVDIIILYQV